MKCPYCNKEAIIDDVAKMHIETYGKSVRARTRCCNAILYVYGVMTFRCDKTNQKGQDDWDR
jgi:hypothetical protein